MRGPESWEVRGLQEEAHHFNELYYRYCTEAVDSLAEKFGNFRPHAWVILGSGLGGLASVPQLENPTTIPFAEIPHFPLTGAPGHKGELVAAYVGETPVVFQSGRTHIHETGAWSCPPAVAAKLITLPIRVAKGLGIKVLVISNAAGALDNGIVKKGDVVAILDESNYLGISPLMGTNDPRLGDAEGGFHGKQATCDYKLLQLFVRCIDPQRFHIGIYHTSPSTPEYEGVMDILRAQHDKGALPPAIVHLFGMSFGIEIAAARHCNQPPKDPHGLDRPLEILGLSLATNIIPQPQIPTLSQILRGEEEVVVNPTTPGEVIRAGREAEAYFIPAMLKFLEQLPQGSNSLSIRSQQKP